MLLLLLLMMMKMTTMTLLSRLRRIIAIKLYKKLSYRLENRASATYFFLAKLISIAHSCL